MDGRYGDSRLREEVYEAFDMPIGDALYLNDLFVLGSAIDVEQDGWLIDAWAEGEVADWLDENGVTTGTTFEAKLRFAHEIVKNGGRIPGGAPRDVYHAKLIMLEGIMVTEKEPKKPKSSRANKENESIILSTKDMDNMPSDILETLRTLLINSSNE